MLHSVFNPSCLGNQQMLQPREAIYPSWVTTRQVPSLDGTASLLPSNSAASQLGRRQLSTCRTELPLMNRKALSGQAPSYLSNLTPMAPSYSSLKALSLFLGPWEPLLTWDGVTSLKCSPQSLCLAAFLPPSSQKSS